MLHATLQLQDLTAALAAKGRGPGIPVAPVYSGLLPNAQASLLTVGLALAGDITGVTLSANALTIGPASATIGPLMAGQATLLIFIPQGATQGKHQARLDVLRGGVPIGRFVITVLVLDLAAANIEDLVNPPILNGVLDLLQVGRDDFVVLP